MSEDIKIYDNLYEETLAALWRLKSHHIDQAHETYVRGIKLVEWMNKRVLVPDGIDNYVGADFTINGVDCKCVTIDLGGLASDPYADFMPLRMSDDLGSGAGNRITIKSSEI